MDGMVKVEKLKADLFPNEIHNWIGGKQVFADSGEFFNKMNPADGELICRVARSKDIDVKLAVRHAKEAQVSWSDTPPVKRGMILHEIVRTMQDKKYDIASIVALETGKSRGDALGETEGAIELGLFYSSEGQRLYGRTTTSRVSNRYAMTIRQPVGVAGLIVAANTPIANIAWKVFPALICGNSAVLKPAEDSPITAWFFGKISHDSGIPKGVLNIIQGLGNECGASLVENADVGVISFTGSTKIGIHILATAGKRLAKVSLELGGKNPLIVCDDADLENAAKWTILSAFSNAGQRCAAASRIIIFDAVYDRFREMLIEKTKQLNVGPNDDDDLGPVISEKQLHRMLSAVENARKKNATILTGGQRLLDGKQPKGLFHGSNTYRKCYT